MSMTTLRNKRILITRPAHQANNLKRFILSAGGIPIVCPMITIEYLPLNFHVADAQATDIAIFVSANAVFPLKQKFDQLAHAKIIAIGPGTAKAIIDVGGLVDYLPEYFSSEGLLTLPILSAIHHKTIRIFCGEHSRPLLQQTLQQRGALVQQTVCYRRTVPTLSTNILKTLQQPIDLIISTSNESLRNMTQLLKKRQGLLQCSLLVISENMRLTAQSLGYTEVLCSNSANDEAIMAFLRYNWLTGK